MGVYVFPSGAVDSYFTIHRQKSARIHLPKSRLGVFDRATYESALAKVDLLTGSEAERYGTLGPQRSGAVAVRRTAGAAVRQRSNERSTMNRSNSLALTSAAMRTRWLSS